MRLNRFSVARSPTAIFGVAIGDQAIPFVALQAKVGEPLPALTDSRSYLAGLPDSERAAKELLAWVEKHLVPTIAGVRVLIQAADAQHPITYANRADRRGAGSA